MVSRNVASWMQRHTIENYSLTYNRTLSDGFRIRPCKYSRSSKLSWKRNCVVARNSGQCDAITLDSSARMHQAPGQCAVGLLIESLSKSFEACAPQHLQEQSPSVSA